MTALLSMALIWLIIITIVTNLWRRENLFLFKNWRCIQTTVVIWHGHPELMLCFFKYLFVYLTNSLNSLLLFQINLAPIKKSACLMPALNLSLCLVRWWCFLWVADLIIFIISLLPFFIVKLKHLRQLLLYFIGTLHINRHGSSLRITLLLHKRYLLHLLIWLISIHWVSFYPEVSNLLLRIISSCILSQCWWASSTTGTSLITICYLIKLVHKCLSLSKNKIKFLLVTCNTCSSIFNYSSICIIIILYIIRSFI